MHDSRWRRTVAKRAMVTAALALVSGYSLSATSGGPDPAAATRTADSLWLVGMTRDGQLLVVFGPDGSWRVHHLSPAVGLLHGPTLALDATGRVLVTSMAVGRQTTRVLRLDLASDTLTTIATVSDSVPYPFIDVGRRTGRVYLVSAVGIRAIVLDEADGHIVRRLGLVRDDWHDWSVYDAHVTPNEDRLYVSYHGGADRASQHVPPARTGFQSMESASVSARRPLVASVAFSTPTDNLAWRAIESSAHRGTGSPNSRRAGRCCIATSFGFRSPVTT